MATLTALTERFTAAAEQEGLADVAYVDVDAPFGSLVVAGTERGLVRIGFGEGVLDELAAQVSPRVLRLPNRLDAVRRQLDEYFAGHRHDFDIECDWRLVRSAFQSRVLAAARSIPFGETATYATVAESAGNAKAVRAAGSALGANPLCIVVPCHRVVRSGGGLGGYAGGLAVKEWLLTHESATPRPPG